MNMVITVSTILDKITIHSIISTKNMHIFFSKIPFSTTLHDFLFMHSRVSSINLLCMKKIVKHFLHLVSALHNSHKKSSHILL